MSDPYDYFDDEPEDLDEWEDCGLMPGGQCAMAGTEYCDFSCANRDSDMFAGSKAWREKHRRPRKKSSQLNLLPSDEP